MKENAYLRFVTSTTSSAIVKIFRLVSKKCELVFWCENHEFCVFFGVKKSGISVFLVSVENSAGVNKMTNITYVQVMQTYASGAIWWPNLQLMHVAPSGGQICQLCRWRLLIRIHRIENSRWSLISGDLEFHCFCCEYLKKKIVQIFEHISFKVNHGHRN